MNLYNRLRAAWLALCGRFAHYESARFTTWKSILPGALQDARLDISKWTRTETMRRMRYFEKNSAVARRLGSVHCDFTVGPNGIQFSPASSDLEWNARAKAYLDKTLSVLDLNTRQGFGSLQQIMAWRDFFDGDVFVIKTRGQDNSGRWHPRVQIVEAHLCETPKSEQAREGVSIIDGVEVDVNGRPTGYWFRTASDREVYRLVDAGDVVAVYDPDRAGQVRGMSALAAAYPYLHQLQDLLELEMRAVADAAEKSTFIKTQNGEIPAGLLRPGPEPIITSPNDATVLADYDARAQQLQQAVGGRTQALRTGEDVIQFQPARPTDATRWLWSYLTSCVCGAVGIPKMLCFSEWLDGAQGTVVRGDYHIAAQMFRARSEVYASALREIIIYVLRFGIKNEIALADPPADWFNVSYTAPRACNVDVGRNSTAQQNELKIGLTTHETAYAEQGMDAREQITNQIRFIAFVKQKCAEVSNESGVTVKPEEILGEIVTGGFRDPRRRHDSTVETESSTEPA